MTNKPWVEADPLTHFFCLKMIRDMPQGVWVPVRCPLIHFFCLKIMKNMPQHAWVVSHCFFTHALCFKMV